MLDFRQLALNHMLIVLFVIENPATFVFDELNDTGGRMSHMNLHSLRYNLLWR
jgi:hypothetical protein